MEQIGNIVIEFDIFSTRPTNLVVADSSEWLYAINLPAYILVKLPGSKKFKTFPFKKNALNRLQEQLKSGVKTQKGSFETKIPLTESDTKRIRKEIATLKSSI